MDMASKEDGQSSVLPTKEIPKDIRRHGVSVSASLVNELAALFAHSNNRKPNQTKYMVHNDVQKGRNYWSVVEQV